MSEDIVDTLRKVALAIDSDDDDLDVIFVTGDLLLEAAREIDYLRSRIARLEGLA